MQVLMQALFWNPTISIKLTKGLIEIADVIHNITSYFPNLKKELLIAHLKQTPQDFIRKNLKSSLLYSFLLTVMFFFVLDKARLPKLLLLPVLIIFFALFFGFGFLKVKAQIRKRAAEIDKEILFAGRYLLVKLYSGRPLLNSLLDTSRSYGVASKYVKEIVDDIDTGSTIEEALEKAMTYSPSEKFKKILFQVNDALRLGIDVTKPLEAVIEEITHEQEIEVKRYGRKLNSVVIFYMLLAVVVPSIGMTMMIVVSSFINFPIGFREFFVVIIFIIIIQLVFISTFRSIRPQVNL